MLVTKSQFAAMNGVSAGTAEWMTTKPDARPISLGYVEVSPVLIAPATFARLWAASDTTVRYWVRRGRIPLHESGRVDVHEGDLFAYWDNQPWPPELPDCVRKGQNMQAASTLTMTRSTHNGAVATLPTMTRERVGSR